MKHVGDITKLNGAELEVVDCITGGSPCQDLSVAGKRAGLAGERSGLFMEQIRIVKEMREHDRKTGRSGRFVRPRYMVWENVPGAFSSNKGKDFAAVLEEIVRIAEPEAPDVPVPDKGWPKSELLYDVGGKWSVAWRVHDAQFWGVPQRRKRISLVADFGGLTAPEILFERKGLSGNFEQSGAQREEAPRTGGSGVESASDPSVLCLNDQGGSIRSVSEDVSGCLRAQEHGHQPIIAGFKAGQSMADGMGSIVPTLTGDHENRVTDYTAICVGNGQLNQISMAEQANTLDTVHDQQAVMVFDTTQITSPQNRSWPKYGDPCHTLAAGAHIPALVETYQAVTGPLMANSHPESYTGQDAYNDMLVAGLDCRNGRENGDLCGTLQSKPNGGFSYNCIHPVRIRTTVRRLTPLECERLQGYPDGWTDIGDWVDSKGKKHKAADSPRYKALGNSIALPFWQWLIKRISAQYERDSTMGSLFDGIGGFPYCWERVNGKGSARWASEIEEFPMAVTKIRFGEE